MASEYSLNDKALLKLLLHSAKYPANSINGVLLGKPRSSSVVEVVDCIPLFHTALTLAPGLEIALTQIESYSKREGLEVVAYYFSDARFNSSDLHAIGKRITDKLADRTAHACAIVLNNELLAKFLRQGDVIPLELFLKSNKDWKKVASGSTAPARIESQQPLASVRKQFAALFSAQHHNDLVDFDEHLDDVRRDWLNSGLKLTL